MWIGISFIMLSNSYCPAKTVNSDFIQSLRLNVEHTQLTHGNGVVTVTSYDVVTVMA